MGWRNLSRFIASLEERGELIRIDAPTKVKFTAGCIADKLVKNGGPAVIFENPILDDGTGSQFRMVMNLFGTRERVNLALGLDTPSKLGERLVSLMKPDISTISKHPWKGIPLLKSAMSLPPRRTRRGACQQVVIDNPDLTKLPIPTTWPHDGGPFITLPLVVTKEKDSGVHNLGMYRGQIHGPKEVGLHWQAHKHGAAHASEVEQDGRMDVAVCIGGPPELIFSAIAPLPDNLEEYMFSGLLSGKRLKLTRCITSDLLVPSECDLVIEGYTIPSEKMIEGPFGDHFGYYSGEDEYPVMHVTKVTHRKNALLPMTIVGQPPMEDGYIGEAVGDGFLPVLQFQNSDILGLHLPLETGFHNLAILSSKTRYPMQGRKNALWVLGSGQLMFLKVVIVGPDGHDVKDMEQLLDILHKFVFPKRDFIVLPDMVADSLEHAAPIENRHSKLIIDATRQNKAEGVEQERTDSNELLQKVIDETDAEQARFLRPSILVVTIKSPDEKGIREGRMADDSGERIELCRNHRRAINELRNSIWQLDNGHNIRFLFITDADLNLYGKGSRRRLLWQLFNRFDVERDLTWDQEDIIGENIKPLGKRICWDATTPHPHPGRDALIEQGIALSPLDPEKPIRGWPGVTLHSLETMDESKALLDECGLDSLDWPDNIMI